MNWMEIAVSLLLTFWAGFVLGVFTAKAKIEEQRERRIAREWAERNQ